MERSLTQGRIACMKNGVVSVSFSCRRFKYDPLKRIPPKPVSLGADKYKSEDFSLT